MGNGDSQFSRNGTTSAEGKLDARIDIPSTVALEEKLIALAVIAGKPKAEYGRILLTKAIEGEFAYLRSIGTIPQQRDGTNGG